MAKVKQKEWIEVGVVLYYYNTGAGDNGDYLHKLKFNMDERDMVQSFLDRCHNALEERPFSKSCQDIAVDYFGVDGFLDRIHYVKHVRKEKTDISQEFTI